MPSIGILGKPYRVVYTSINFVPRLSQIHIKIIKPDLTISESLPMTEFDDTDLKGCYYYDFETVHEDSLGDYIMIINNLEQNHKVSLRVTYQSEQQSVALDTISSGLLRNYFGG